MDAGHVEQEVKGPNRLWQGQRLAPTLPRHPDVTAGRVYPLNVHGIVVHQTREERKRLNEVQYSSIAVFAVSALMAALHRKKFGRPPGPPSSRYARSIRLFVFTSLEYATDLSRPCRRNRFLQWPDFACCGHAERFSPPSLNFLPSSSALRASQRGLRSQIPPALSTNEQAVRRNLGPGQPRTNRFGGHSHNRNGHIEPKLVI